LGTVQAGKRGCCMLSLAGRVFDSPAGLAAAVFIHRPGSQASQGSRHCLIQAAARSGAMGVVGTVVAVVVGTVVVVVAPSVVAVAAPPSVGPNMEGRRG
jgi:hypothetical protein